MGIPKDVRNGLIGKIHIAKAELKLDDESYRTILFSLTGKESCKDMTLSQLNHVMDALVKRGYVVKVKRSPPAPLNKGGEGKGKKIENSPAQKKIWALWFQLVDAGVVERSAKALNAFIKRQTGIEKIEWVNTAESEKAVIEALKARVAREVKK